ncbi:MAG: dihydroorotate dehydrogenase [Lachnospirales bacterium]
MKVNFCGIEFKNPITTASGTFGSGMEYDDFVDLNKLGSITVKGVSTEPWTGNKPSRIAETYGGMLNSVGLQNKGVDYFINNDLPFLKKYDTKVIVNLCGHTVEEYVSVTEKIRDADVDILELNISCPNVSAGGITFGINEKAVFEVVSKVKKVAKQPLVVKLSPNVSDITAIAKVAEEAGADGLSLINTLIGMKIDIKKRKTVLNNRIGGLSGPCIKPVALNMVNKVYHSVNIPIIGMGGVTTYEDAVEFIMAGSTLVAVGTANFINPYATVEIINGLEKYLKEENTSLDEIRGII